jgi:hypothetical protein
MGKGYKGKNPAGGKGGSRGGRGDGGAPEGALKKKWTKGDPSDSGSDASEEESGSEDETAEKPVKEQPRRPVPGELPPNSSDEDDSGSESESESDDDPLLNPHARPKASKVAEPAIAKSQKELEADMEKLKLVREKRAKEAAERIAREGYDRYLPPGAPGGPPAK